MPNYKNAIVVFGGGLVKEKGRWRTTNFDDRGDNFGINGGRLRVVATSLLYKNDKSFLIITSGGRGQLRNIPDVPSVSNVAKNELIKLDVHHKDIIEENKSNNTYQQLLELEKIIKRKDLQKIIIISNKFHLPRIKAMIEYNCRLSKLKRMYNNSRLKVKSAEGITLRYEPESWHNIINRAYKSEEMKERIRLEQRGVKQIKRGIYKFK